jgi:hypothetical protein
VLDDSKVGHVEMVELAEGEMVAVVVVIGYELEAGEGAAVVEYVLPVEVEVVEKVKEHCGDEEEAWAFPSSYYC